eukprot:TRINITY_DN8436_c0_g1_i1.p1 TRINITY_DN8436_c0_g1~~TRINITY_DN8436_c0_g1_i1.p1  ORF type:complete len:264 (-),score=31.89 TRINITY_DN8436_c0_g1_i1:243-1034(-)
MGFLEQRLRPPCDPFHAVAVALHRRRRSTSKLRKKALKWLKSYGKFFLVNGEPISELLGDEDSDFEEYLIRMKFGDEFYRGSRTALYVLCEVLGVRIVVINLEPDPEETTYLLQFPEDWETNKEYLMPPRMGLGYAKPQLPDNPFFPFVGKLPVISEYVPSNWNSRRSVYLSYWALDDQYFPLVKLYEDAEYPLVFRDNPDISWTEELSHYLGWTDENCGLLVERNNPEDREAPIEIEDFVPFEFKQKAAKEIWLKDGLISER